MAAIRTERLRKFYGKARGIVDVDLEVQVGEVFGFLGPNGAGKTTTIRTLLDLIRPSSGTATVLGLDSVEDSMEIRRRVGYLPDELPLWDWMTPRQVLDHLSRLRGGVDTAYRDELIERFQVEADRKVADLSTGNKQKIGLVQAFMHRPELLILDEPTSGLDPLMQQVTYEMIDEAQRDGRTVFLSSHVLPEVERIAQRVGIIRKGRLVEVASVESLKERALRLVEVRFGYPVPGEDRLASVDGVSEVSVTAETATLKVEGSMDPLVKAIADYEVLVIRTHDTPLEEIFLQLYKNGRR
ncbi:MAG TPA: ABC transporter ATP-binding protein [Acidimicrobiia bacterium]|nr:ABC transporter ATP-binding protein [Acidimicrobiia bacterium]